MLRGWRKPLKERSAVCLQRCYAKLQSTMKRRINRANLAKTRQASQNGRLQRTLSKTIFSRGYIACVMGNPDGLLRMPYLIRELQATKRVLKALRKRLDDPELEELYEKINLLDGGTAPTSPLCAIARHQMARSMHLDLDSFFFDDCIDEWTMETIVHGVTEYVEGLKDLAADARTSFRTIQTAMSAAGAGYVEVGAFEPDLRSIENYQDRAALKRLCEERNWPFPEGGGYVLCSHRLVRVQSNVLYQSLLRSEFPGYRRTQRKKLDRDKTLQENVEDILDYIWKLEDLVGGINDDAEFDESDCRRCIRVASLGTTSDGLKGNRNENDLCEFALFLDRLGLGFFKINYVNMYARAWYNQDERKMFLKDGLELMDAPGVSSGVLHSHCNDAPRRRLIQETPTYEEMSKRQRTRITFAHLDMRKLNTSRHVGPLIPTGRKLAFENGIEGYSMPIIKLGARFEKNNRRAVPRRRIRKGSSPTSRKPAVKRWN